MKINTLGCLYVCGVKNIHGGILCYSAAAAEDLASTPLDTASARTFLLCSFTKRNLSPPSSPSPFPSLSSPCGCRLAALFEFRREIGFAEPSVSLSATSPSPAILVSAKKNTSIQVEDTSPSLGAASPSTNIFGQ
uniref:Uncharacterized protein n=1 Tax=Triticum urartu TaxID=4572 RepID=A0A8R7TUE4_TRIUA